MKLEHTSPLGGITSGLAGLLLLLGHVGYADVFGNWTTNQVSTNRFGLKSVVYGNGCYVAAGDYSDFGAIVSSEDGLNWTVRADGGWQNPAGAPRWGLKVNFANGRFIATSAWSGTAVSTNGTTWALGDAPLGSGSLYLFGATFGNGTYVAVGQRESVFGTTVSNIITSPDGINWTLRRSHPTEAGTITDVAYGAGRFVSIGANDGFTYTSPTGTAWTRRGILGGSSISYCSNIFIVPFGVGTNLISPNGTNWVAQNTGLQNTLGKVIFANGLFMARAGNSLATSTDGTNWVQYLQALPGQSLATDGSRLVTVGQEFVTVPYLQNKNGFVYTSDKLAGMRLVNSAPTIGLSGLVGRSYRIDYTDSLVNPGANNWQTLTNLQLPSNPFNFTDLTATNSPQRFYRSVLLP